MVGLHHDVTALRMRQCQGISEAFTRRVKRVARADDPQERDCPLETRRRGGHVAQAVRLKVTEQDLGGQVEVAALALVHVIEFDFLVHPTAGHSRAGLIHGTAVHAGVVHVTGRVAGRQGNDAVCVAHFGHVGHHSIGAEAVAGQQDAPVTLRAKGLHLRADLLQGRRVAGVVAAPAGPGHFNRFGVTGGCHGAGEAFKKARPAPLAVHHDHGAGLALGGRLRQRGRQAAHQQAG